MVYNYKKNNLFNKYNLMNKLKSLIQSIIKAINMKFNKVIIIN